MQIFLASDHRGYDLKGRLCANLPRALIGLSTPVNIIDLGPKSYDPNDDYNDAARAVAQAVLNAEKITRPAGGREVFGILICGSAIGISIQANRFKGIRAAVVTNLETAESSRSHNDANVLCLSADQLATTKDPLETEQALEDLYALIEKFLATPFSGEERHQRRIKRLDEEIKL
ncbi:RpiB/LacA/LacB family sugar-phosphate isomerase [Candidatus Saccharibacteria bacterium]|nr:RpiB/LacA/LacB family sugar-phosphate isomerase [Candidatus Saccharibacteria bacterium]